MTRTTITLLKIARALMVLFCIICCASIFGLVGKIEVASDSMLAYYTKPVIWLCIGAVVSFISAKITSNVIKYWG